MRQSRHAGGLSTARLRAGSRRWRVHAANSVFTCINAAGRSYRGSIRTSAADLEIDRDGHTVFGDRTVRPFSEDWTFQRSPGAVTDNKPSTLECTCPGCDAPVALTQIGECHYCKAAVTSGIFDWVVSRIDPVESTSVVGVGLNGANPIAGNRRGSAQTRCTRRIEASAGARAVGRWRSASWADRGGQRYAQGGGRHSGEIPRRPWGIGSGARTTGRGLVQGEKRHSSRPIEEGRHDLESQLEADHPQTLRAKTALARFRA